MSQWNREKKWTAEDFVREVLETQLKFRGVESSVGIVTCEPVHDGICTRESIQAAIAKCEREGKIQPNLEWQVPPKVASIHPSQALQSNDNLRLKKYILAVLGRGQYGL